MVRLWLTLVVLLFVFKGETRTLLVSDVDDTIKLAYVKDLKDAFFFAFDSESRFMGMSQLYNLIKKDQSDLEVYYLSNAPEWFMEDTHKDFLENGNFPVGEYIGKSDYSSSEHKVKSLRKILAKVQPDKVILIGDNGQIDAKVYQQISEEFSDSGIEFHQFIRIVYNQERLLSFQPSFFSKQTGFVTPIEISLELEKVGILSTSSVQWMIDYIVPALVYHNTFNEAVAQEHEFAFPYFVNCRDFIWKWDEDVQRFEGLKLLKKGIVKRCRIAG